MVKSPSGKLDIAFPKPVVEPEPPKATGVTIKVKKGKYFDVDLPPKTQVSIHRYDVPKEDLIDKDPKGKPCSTQHWIKYGYKKSGRDPEITTKINVFVGGGKVMQIKAPKGIEVKVIEEN